MRRKRSFHAPGNVSRFQIAANQRLFQLKAQNDVHIVRGFIRFHTDEGLLTSLMANTKSSSETSPKASGRSSEFVD